MARKLKKTFYIFAAFFALLFIAGGIFAATFNINHYRPQIESALRNYLQRDVSFQDNIEFHVFPNPTVKLLDVTIGNPAWAKTPYLAHIDEFDLKVALSPLFSKQIVIEAIAVNKADVHLEQQGDRKNWDFMQSGKSASADEAPRDIDPKKAFVPLGVNKASITNSVVRIIQNGKQSEYNVQNLNFEWPQGENAKVDFAFLVGKENLSGTLHGGTLALWQSDNDFPVEADIAYDGIKATAKGSVKGRAEIEQIKGDFTLTSNTGIDAKGETTIDFSEDKSFHASLHLTQLFFNNGSLTAKAETEVEPPNAQTVPNEKVIPDIVFPRNLFGSVRGTADFTIDSLKKGATDFGSVTGHVVAAKGVFSSDNIKISMTGAPLQISFNYNSASPMPRLSFALQSSNLDYGTLLKTFSVSSRFTGSAALHLSLNGSGMNLREWFSGSSGDFTLNAGQGTFSQKYLRTFGSDMLKILSPGGTKSDITSIRCAVIRGRGQNGIFNAAPVGVNTDVVSLLGKGTLDMKSETLNIFLSPVQNDRVKLADYIPALRITGPLANPKAVADQQGIASSAARLAEKNEKLKGISQIFDRLAGNKNSVDHSLDNECVSFAKAEVAAPVPSTQGEQPKETSTQPVPEQKKKPNALDLLNAIGKELQKN